MTVASNQDRAMAAVVIAALMLGPRPVAAQPAPTVPEAIARLQNKDFSGAAEILEKVTTNEPVRIIHEWRGESVNDQFGWVARDIGDVNGDGVHDVTTSAPSHSNTGEGAVLLTLTGEQTGDGFGSSAGGHVSEDGLVTIGSIVHPDCDTVHPHHLIRGQEREGPGRIGEEECR